MVRRFAMAFACFGKEALREHMFAR